MSVTSGATIEAEDEYFAMIPEWVLFHPDLTAQAVRLYGALKRYANAKNRCHPGRQALADAIHVKSRSTVDRCADQLERVGALDVTPRFDDAGDRTSNSYYVRFSPPRHCADHGSYSHACAGCKKAQKGSRVNAATPSRGTSHGSRKNAATGGRVDAAQNQNQVEPEPVEPHHPQTPSGGGEEERSSHLHDPQTKAGGEGERSAPEPSTNQATTPVATPLPIEDQARAALAGKGFPAGVVKDAIAAAVKKSLGPGFATNASDYALGAAERMVARGESSGSPKDASAAPREPMTDAEAAHLLTEIHNCTACSDCGYDCPRCDRLKRDLKAAGRGTTPSAPVDTPSPEADTQSLALAGQR